MSEPNKATVSEEELIHQGYRKYMGEKVHIFYNTSICQHVGNCVRGNPNVFEVGRKPWIVSDNASGSETIQVVNTCPTGALKYIQRDKCNLL